MTQEILEIGTKVSHSNIFNHVKSLISKNIEIDDLIMNPEECIGFFTAHHESWLDFMLSINDDIKAGINLNPEDDLILLGAFVKSIFNTISTGGSINNGGILSLSDYIQESGNPFEKFTKDRLRKPERDWNSFIDTLDSLHKNTHIQESVRGEVLGILVSSEVDG